MYAGLPGDELTEMLHHASWAREKVMYTFECSNIQSVSKYQCNYTLCFMCQRKGVDTVRCRLLRISISDVVVCAYILVYIVHYLYLKPRSILSNIVLYIINAL